MEVHFDNLDRILDNLQADCNKHSKHPSHSQQHRFYPRMVNLTNIAFTKEEQELLDLGMQYNIRKATPDGLLDQPHTWKGTSHKITGHKT